MLTVSSINVNGIRAATRKGFTQWLHDTTADVVCLQEVRATPQQIPAEVAQAQGWHLLLAPSIDKGRSGVAILARDLPGTHRIGFGSEEFDDSGRYIEIDTPNVIIASLYLPSGEVGTERQDQKERFMAQFGEYLQQLRKRAVEQNQEVIVCGDWNIAHREQDLKNWKNNRKNAGFLPEERQWLTDVLDSGYVDVTRALHPDSTGPYSWWSYRGRAFDNDAGWRIDYHIATPTIAATATSSIVERAASHDQRWSDHAPVTTTYQF